MHHVKWLSWQKICYEVEKADDQSCWLCNGGIEFKNITKLEAHVVILATGFNGTKKVKTNFPEPFL